MTETTFPIVDSESITYHELLEAYASSNESSGSVKDRIAQIIGEESDSEVMQKLEWLGLFRKKKINLANATPAIIMENLLLDKWKLKPKDKDMVVMHHVFEYELDGERKRLKSTLQMIGDHAESTAMSKLVGLPLGIFVKLVMQGKITSTGVHIPVKREVYEPVLQELQDYGVVFKNQESTI